MGVRLTRARLAEVYGMLAAKRIERMKAEGCASTVPDWLKRMRKFIQERTTPFVLNVAGPRESKSRGIQKRVRRFLTEAIGGMIETA